MARQLKADQATKQGRICAELHSRTDWGRKRKPRADIFLFLLVTTL
jgi:hypothetical protein